MSSLVMCPPCGGRRQTHLLVEGHRASRECVECGARYPVPWSPELRARRCAEDDGRAGLAHQRKLAAKVPRRGTRVRALLADECWHEVVIAGAPKLDRAGSPNGMAWYQTVEVLIGLERRPIAIERLEPVAREVGHA